MAGCVLLLSGGGARGQLVSALSLESAGDVYDALAGGAIDEAGAAALLALIRDPVDLNGTELERLLIIPGFTPHDLARLRRCRSWRGRVDGVDDLAPALGAQVDALRAFVTVRAQTERRRLWGWARWQLNRDLQPQGGGDDNAAWDLRARPGLGEWRWRMRLNLDEAGRTTLRERSLRCAWQWGDGGWGEVVVGNLRPRWGLGLTLGPGSLLPSAWRSSPRAAWLQPDQSVYNGAQLAAERGVLRVDALVSNNRFDVLHERVGAGLLEGDWGFASGGLMMVHNELRAPASNEQRSWDHWGLFGGQRWQRLRLRQEVAWSRGGGGAAEGRIELSGKRFESAARLWAMGRDFTNLHGGGSAVGEAVEVVVFPGADLHLSDRRVGKGGGALELRLLSGDSWLVEGDWARVRSSLDGSTTTWGSGAWGWRRNARRRWQLRLVWKEGSGRSRTGLFDGRWNPTERVDLRARLALDEDLGSKLPTRGLDVRLESSWRRWAPYCPWVRWRWRDADLDEGGDAYMELTVQEVLSFGEHWELRARLRARRDQDRAGTVIEARVRVQVRG